MANKEELIKQGKLRGGRETQIHKSKKDYDRQRDKKKIEKEIRKEIK